MAKRFKKGSIEAKRFMAKIRLKKGKPKATKKSLGSNLSINAENFLKIIKKLYPKTIVIDTTTPSKDINKAILELEGKKLIKKLSYNKGFAEYGIINKNYNLNALASINKKDKVYIEFLNKKKNFKKDIKNFNSYAEALNYGKNNLDNFSPDMIKYKNYNLNALAPINKSEQTLSFVPKVITENQILKEINKVKEEILHLLAMQKEHILKGHKRSLGALVKNKQKEIGNLLKKCK